MQETPLISVIIPCYNGEQYIEKTLQHVLSQTFTNWECIVVDDGSSDNSKEIINAFENLDNRIIYYYQDNQGLSGSRNSGTKISKGKYIYYLDADDLIDKNTLQNFVNLIPHNTDIIFGKTALTDGHNKNIIGYLEHFLPVNQKLANTNYKLVPMVLNDKVSCVAHNRLYKKAFITKHNLAFKDRLLHEDELWFFETLINCQSIILSDQTTYYYNTGNQNSITNNFSIKNTKAYLDILDTIYQKYYLIAESPEAKNVTNLYLNYFKMTIITHCYFNTPNQDKEDVNKLITNAFNAVKLPEASYNNLNNSLKQLHQNFKMVLPLGLDKTLNYLRWYRSKSLKKIMKRQLILIQAKMT